MTDLCRSCSRRGRCHALCAPAEAYADRDRVARSWRIRPIDPLAFDYLFDQSPRDRLQNRYRPMGLTWAELIGVRELGEEEWAIVESCGLTDRQKEAFYLHHWARLPIAEVARLTGTSRQVASTHIGKGARKIMDRLRPVPPDTAIIRRFVRKMEALINEKADKPPVLEGYDGPEP